MAARAASGDPGGRFAAAMAAAAPFESRPRLAVALSGGADSSALVLLAQDWARGRGGRIVALTVDHGLRPGSRAEARAVAAWCAAREIEHVVLGWEGPKPTRAIQERARIARYALLEEWCRAQGVLHLLLGHHAADQAETIAMRRVRRSGAEGLDGMASIAERTDIRLLRPLLGWRKSELEALLAARGAGWIEDPSNRDPRFARTRLRDSAAVDDPPSGGGVRRAAERRRANWLGRHAAIHPEGWASLRLSAFRALADDEAATMIRATVMAVAGRLHPPRQAALAAAAAWALAAPSGGRRHLAGCALCVTAKHLAILRNPAACRSAAAAGARDAVFDGRFRVRRKVTADGSGDPSLVPLRSLARRAIPASGSPALQAAGLLPAVRNLDGSVCVLHVLYGRASCVLVSVDSTDVSFRPIRALAGAAFAGPEAVKMSSTLETPVGLAPAQARLPERVVPP